MIEEKIKQNISLAPLTTFKIGGPAKFFIEVKTREDLMEAIGWAVENEEKFFIFGGGSNMLINDKGVDGLIIKLNNNELAVRGQRIEVGAGVLFSRVVAMARGNNLSGLEWAIGIPGSLGGAVAGNAGAFGSSIADSIETVEIFNIKKNDFDKYSRNHCGFAYRESIFKKDNNLIVWSVTLNLKEGRVNDIESLLEKYSKERRNSQPNLPSAGSVFKGVNIKDLEGFNQDLAKQAVERGVVKDSLVSAGWLIDLLGLKGKIIGGVKISLEHANFIVNTGKGTSDDVIMLISYIKQQVRDRLGVQLQEEIRYLGF